MRLDPVSARIAMRSFADIKLVKLKGYPQRLSDMHTLYGATEGEKCGTCKYLAYHERRNRYYKCEKFGFSFGAGTDWRKKWPACGAWEE